MALSATGTASSTVGTCRYRKVSQLPMPGLLESEGENLIGPVTSGLDDSDLGLSRFVFFPWYPQALWSINVHHHSPLMEDGPPHAEASIHWQLELPGHSSLEVLVPRDRLKVRLQVGGHGGPAQVETKKGKQPRKRT